VKFFPSNMFHLQANILGPSLWFMFTIVLVCFWGNGWPERLLQRYFIADHAEIHTAAYWIQQDHGVVCQLCPRHCFLPEGGRGWCRVRVNMNQRLYTQVYGLPAAMHVDPIEKKPVFHLLPGSRAFSIATAGCNLSCKFCQNWTLSTANPETLPGSFLSPRKVVALAQQTGCRSIAYTYSEPVIFYEYMVEVAKLAHEAGLYNVMITAGYIEVEPLQRLLPLMDVIKVDLKGFDNRFYRRVVNGELKYIQRTLKIIADFGTQLEVVNLLVPTQNDSPEQIWALSCWIAEELGNKTPVFFSRFTPHHQMRNLPVTPYATMQRARKIALEAGLQYVYMGNILDPSGENTFCPNCQLVLVERHGYTILRNRLENRETCPRCGEYIPGIWTDFRSEIRNFKGNLSRNQR